LNSTKVVATGDTSDIVSCQAELDCKVAANGARTNNGYAQRHEGVRVKKVDMRKVFKSKSVCKGRRIVILN
jgi:hypothetical protein